jgi:hypothetical protein
MAVDGGAAPETCRKLGQLYYRVRDGLGFNKSPAGYGAFPTDPYSHTPGHGGAQQPGMTGQVKEEILTRFGELGLRVADGAVHFAPRLLRACEFEAAARRFRFLDVDGRWETLQIDADSLAYTWCQVPIVYNLRRGAREELRVTFRDGTRQTIEGLSLPAALSTDLFRRSGRIRAIELDLTADMLLDA